MDKKFGRTQTKFESVRDRGDLRKTSPTKENTETNTKVLSERGDTVQRSKNNINFVKKPSFAINEQKSLIKTSDKDEGTKREQAILKEPNKKVTEKKEKSENQIRTYLDFEGRRRLQKRYTLKLNNQKQLVKNEVKIDKEKSSDKEEKKSLEECLKTNNSVKSIKSDRRKEAPKKRPMIKTITVKNDNRIYKAVTFVEQKKQTPAPLQIKIPTDIKKKVSKSTETNFKCPNPVNENLTPFPVPSKASIKEKTKRDKKRKRVFSPDAFSSRENRSPVTEVAKWAASSLNDHTKPYYEAWVDTTLTAISKCTDAQKEDIYRNLRAQQPRRPSSPELFYENFYDERYSGKIKVNTKQDRMRVRKR